MRGVFYQYVVSGSHLAEDSIPMNSAIATAV
jgi:hypothetical protein